MRFVANFSARPSGVKLESVGVCVMGDRTIYGRALLEGGRWQAGLVRLEAAKRVRPVAAIAARRRGRESTHAPMPPS